MGQNGSQEKDARNCCQYKPLELVTKLPAESNGKEFERQESAPDVSNVQAVVQFSSAVFFTTEDEGELEIDIQRLGDCSGRASFRYYSRDASAVAGRKYVATSGDMVFEPGETNKIVKVEILADTSFDATLEFSLHLTDCQGAQLGMYLKDCRVKIIDDDKFPSEKYVDMMDDGRRSEISSFGLMWEFISRILLRNDIVRRDTWKVLFMDQATGLYFFLTLYLQMYLVDVVLNPKEEEAGEEGGHEEEGIGEEEGMGMGTEEEKRRLLLRGIHLAAGYLGRMLGEEEGEEEEEEESGLLPHTLIIPGHRKKTAIVIGLIYVLPYIGIHILAQWRCWLRVAGTSRKILQANLMRKFFNYREEHRSTLKAGEFTMVMVRDVREVIDFGFMKVLEILRIVGKLGLALIFILTESRTALIPLMVYPVLLGSFLWCRQAQMLKVSEERAEKEDHLVSSIGEAVNNYRLINDYQIRPLIVDSYEESIGHLNRSEQCCNSFLSNNAFAPRWLTVIFVGGYMVFGSSEVSTVGGTISLGTFLATINVFKEVGHEIEEIYHECVEIQRSIGPLLKITDYMNAGTDLNLRMRINRFRRALGKELRQLARAKSQSEVSSLGDGLMKMGSFCSVQKSDDAGKFPADDVPIQIKDLMFQFSGKDVFRSPVSMEFTQGKMYALVGPSRQGKGTLLKLIGQVLLPTSDKCLGSIFVPSHLRILHVSNEVAILRKNLLENILMGQSLTRAGGMERIIQICQRLKFSEDMMNLLVRSEEDEDFGWMTSLSHTDCSRLSLARVFVMNSEVVVLHKPTINFNQQEADDIVELFREHVNERGLELPAEMRKFRRPRTLFYTTAVNRGLEIADAVIKVSKEAITSLTGVEVLESAAKDHVWH